MLLEKPDWLKIKTRRSDIFDETEKILRKLSLNTVCEEAQCPNRAECFSKRIATFMILGSVCTRNCTFCNVEKDIPNPPIEDEPERVARAVLELNLQHVVITSVTRDDLIDGGAEQFVKTIEKIREMGAKTSIEVLIPDFCGDKSALDKIIAVKPDIINHNVETVPSLYINVRPQALYSRSLELLENVKLRNNNVLTKSGIMLGFGEKIEEVYSVILDLKKVGCDILTVGQYLAPSLKHHPVVEYIHPHIFEKIRDFALDRGFLSVLSAPLVRSSYKAEKFKV